MLNAVVIMLSIVEPDMMSFLLNFVTLNIVMLSVVMLTVIMQGVVAPDTM
jgi:hypothetical protein